MTWAAEMAVGMDTGVPWVMCKEDDAPDPVYHGGYHGGTNFGRTAGGPFIITSYDYDAPLMNMSHVFSSKPGGCAAFLSNYNANSAATVTFNDRNYELPAWSISVLPDCENVVFNHY
ncbi:Beta-galactosidase [Rosa chinensis]|uniref:beta-galactosidase n=1 Tax=Rosa chinensis TaxID=74649 RepID=A0A2P6PPM8_ROSCH|nr:Beta-galactosidase [Rosa chinensis]